jgi:hypothetical protein
MTTPGLNVPTSLTVAPSAKVKITREIGLLAASEKRTCRADAPTVVGLSLLLETVIGFEGSQLARSIGATEASPIREVRIREVSTFLLFLCGFGDDVVMFGVSDR